MADLYRFINRLHDAILKNIERNNIVLRIPKKLSAKRIDATVPKDFDDLQLWRDMVHIVLSYIFTKNVLQEKTSAYLHSDYLKKELGDNYKKVLEQLIAHKIIQLNDKYVIGVKTNGYALVSEYRKYIFREVQLVTNLQIKRTKKQRVAVAVYQKELLLKQKELVYLLYQDSLQIDVEAALCYLKALEKKLTHEIQEKYTHKNSIEKKEEVTEVVKQMIEHVSRNVKNFNIVNDLTQNTPTVQVRGGRLHTKVSGMMSELRNFLTFNNEEQLVYLDISNSQPYHLTMALQPEFWLRRKQDNKKLTLKNLDRRLYRELSEGEEGRKRYDAIIRSLKPVNESVSKPMIARHSAGPHTANYFCHLVCTGKLYEFTSREFKNKLKVDKELHPLRDRESTKQAFIEMLYSDSSEYFSNSSKLMRIFKKTFPDVADVILYLKSKSKRDLAYLLQGLEAEFIINRISLPLMKENPGLPIYTIHDGIVTTAENAELVRQRINDVYIKEIGVAPNLKVEKLNSKKALDGLKNYTSKKAAKVIADYFKNAEPLPLTQQELLNELLHKLDATRTTEAATEPPAFIDFPDYSFLDVT